MPPLTTYKANGKFFIRGKGVVPEAEWREVRAIEKGYDVMNPATGDLVRIPDDGTPHDWTYYVDPEGEQRVRRRTEKGVTHKLAQRHSAFLDKGWKRARRINRTGIYRAISPATGALQDVPADLQAWAEARDAAVAEMRRTGEPFRVTQTLYPTVP